MADPNQLSNVIAQLEAKINELHQQISNQNNNLQNQLNNQNNQITQQINNQMSQNSSSGLKFGRPNKYSNKNTRAWLQSIQNIFELQRNDPSEDEKIKYAISFLNEEGLEWWDLMNKNSNIKINTFAQFSHEMMNYFEPVNRELNARKILNNLKQMGKFSKISEYNKEFTKYLLQIPSMTMDEAIFHYCTGLKNRIRIEIERAQPPSLNEVMQIADRMDNLYSSGYNSGQSAYSPMEIGNIPFNRSFNRTSLNKGNSNRNYRNNSNNSSNNYTKLQNKSYYNPSLSWKEKQELRRQNKCFVCKKPGCRASNHRNISDNSKN